eukprot:999168_1
MADCYFEDVEYKIAFDADENDVFISKYNTPLQLALNKACTISVKNERLFGVDNYMKLQRIRRVDVEVINQPDGIENNLKMIDDKMIVVDLYRQPMDPKYYDPIVNYKFALLNDHHKKRTCMQIASSAVMSSGCYIYECYSISDMQFAIPFDVCNTLDVYVQIGPHFNFVFLKSFEVRKV